MNEKVIKLWNTGYKNHHKASNISRTLVGNKIVDNSDAVGASPVGAVPTTSSFPTQHPASTDRAKTTARGHKKHLSFEIWCALYQRSHGTSKSLIDYINWVRSTSGKHCFTSSRFPIDTTCPVLSLTFTFPLYVHTWSKSLFFWRDLTVENSRALVLVRSSFMYILQSFSLLYSLKFFLFDISLYLVALDLKRTIIWRGWPGFEFLGLGSRWLTSMSPGCSGGSSSMTSLAIFITASVVSSFSFSGMPDIRRLLRRPYCSRASWSSLSFFISPLSSAMVSSLCARLALRLLTSATRELTLSMRSWFVDFTILANLFAMTGSSRASWKASRKVTSCSSGVGLTGDWYWRCLCILPVLKSRECEMRAVS